MVSIITPCYNSDKFISQTIESVLTQTYTDWELVIVDDCSTDKSKEIIDKYILNDSRIKYYRTKNPSGGPTLPRNIGLQNARGRYIAFLDSDDYWYPNKLELQLPLFNKEEVAIVFSNYEKIKEYGSPEGRVIVAPDVVSYSKLLFGNSLACLTVVFDSFKTGVVKFENIGHEDYALWLNILRQGFVAINTNKNLAVYRVRKDSISSNKIKVIKWLWNIYRNEENLNLFNSAKYLMVDVIKSLIKYFK